jgi:predicted RNA-binding Zn ribbon-like protein
MFAHDTEAALRFAAALVNTLRGEEELLRDSVALGAFLDADGVSGARSGTAGELEAVRTLRARLSGAWDAGEGAVVDLANRLFAEGHAAPRLTRHDGWDWHLHLTGPDAPLVDRIGTEIALGLADLVRAGELRRLRRCEGEDCSAVFVDLSRNRSRRFCDTGNCGNRAHVAAYRARRAAGA